MDRAGDFGISRRDDVSDNRPTEAAASAGAFNSRYLFTRGNARGAFGRGRLEPYRAFGAGSSCVLRHPSAAFLRDFRLGAASNENHWYADAYLVFAWLAHFLVNHRLLQ